MIEGLLNWVGRCVIRSLMRLFTVSVILIVVDLTQHRILQGLCCFSSFGKSYCCLRQGGEA